ncbi:ATP-binding protein [uncultured Kordia sp.]|uniref:HD domain-containing protein n=1 Tax=uncultured Kordia sp. TaxID=507699 RepID=UPI00262A6328|nr:ATP-binding protein [uncultured Kordia sp.]
MNILLPESFTTKLSTNQKIDAIVKKVLANYAEILTENRLYFFEEYTDHGIQHIQNVIYGADNLITKETYNNFLKVEDIASLILSIVLHDIGMHISLEGFKLLIDGGHDNILITDFDKKTWSELWDEYLAEAKRFNGKQLNAIFGDDDTIVENPLIKKVSKINGDDRKLIGEFIRRHHPRLAHEISLSGFPGKSIGIIPFAEDLEIDKRDLIGLIARSHGMNLRSCVNYIDKKFTRTKRVPLGIHANYLMILLRLSDYIQIDISRTSIIVMKTKSLESPISKIEHQAHFSIEHIDDKYQDDPERIYVVAKPHDSQMYLKLKRLFSNIQNEFDVSWAVIGELYGTMPNQPSLKYRRINSNLEDNQYIDKQDYVGDYFTFEANDEITKLLIAPLYGDDPKYGVRELLQNSIDACQERNLIESHDENYNPLIRVNVFDENSNYYFLIKDNGRGMSASEIKRYFLSAGASYRKSLEWKKKFIGDSGQSKVQRNGRFGIGVLAAFLLGDSLEVVTRGINQKLGYEFKADLNTDQINVIKKENIEIGTSIKIKISKEQFEYFNNLNRRYSDTKIWIDWYTQKYPNIIYSINGIEIKNKLPNDPHYNNKNIPNDWHSVDSKGFNKIMWTYSNNYSNNKLVCNGIVILNNSYLGINIWDASLISNKPNISIFDNNGYTPISLDRNNIISKLPFSKDLLIDIYKDIISFFLCYNQISYVNNKNIEILNQALPHPSIKYFNYSYPLNRMNPEFGNKAYLTKALEKIKEILISKKGYVLNYKYFINRLPECNLIYIKTSNYNNLKTLDLDIGNNFVLISDDSSSSIDYYKSAMIESIESYNDESSHSDFFIKKSKYAFLFQDDKKRMPTWFKNYLTLKYEYNNFLALAIGNLKNPSINKSFLKKNHDNFDFIRETALKCNSKADDLFDFLLKKYLGEDVIIPFDMNERIKKYPLAFKELEGYMKKYL